jgi:hypothetical protein
MAVTVLSGTSGALYYKPAGTTGTFGTAGVNTTDDEITIEPYLNLRVGDPVQFSVVNSQTGGGHWLAACWLGCCYHLLRALPTPLATGVLRFLQRLVAPAVDITNIGTAAAPNEFQVAYADYAAVGQVQSWSFEISTR